MVCGIDVYHAGVGQGSKGSVAAFIGSLDKLLTTWHSRVCMQAPHQELVDLLKQCLLSAIKVYREVRTKKHHCDDPKTHFIFDDFLQKGTKIN